jgi:hypothetical protein
MISSPSICDHGTRRDIARDRAIQIRDRLLCALEDAGRPMSPAALARRTGLGACVVSHCALTWRAYFAVAVTCNHLVKKPRVDAIDRHPHLRTYP